MKINTPAKKPSKKLIVSLAAALVIAAGGYAAAAYMNNLWPFYSQDQTDNNKSNKQTNTTPTSDTDDNSDNSDNDDTQEEAGNKAGNYVRPEISNPPTNTSSYPIENERYRIDQSSTTNYTVELYPIINNPSYSDYDAQLRDYKNEVLDYLRSRYGNIDNFKINWIPEDAENI